ncbi:hypothetical protein ABZ820_40520 [Streptomyces diacarni]|uniref:hypothetical protein n=1 Tax=Streptomyces diacarni TaxID=2800381 RepID=UPI003407A69D
MPFESKLSAEKRTEIADAIIAGDKTVLEVSVEYDLPRQTVGNWVLKRRRERSLPTSPKGGDRTLSPAAQRRVSKEKEGRVAAEARADSYLGELQSANARVERLEETIRGMQVTLEYYMHQRPLAGVGAA